MKKVGLALLATLCIAAAPVSDIREYRVGDSSTGSRWLIDQVADGTSCGSAASARTVSAKYVRGFTKLIQYIGLVDANSSVTGVTVTCSASLDGTSYGWLQSRSISSGAMTSNALVETLSSRPTVWISVWDVWGYSYFSCVYACVGGDHQDKLRIQWQAAVGK